MQITIGHYEDPEVLTAAAGFLMQLATIAIDRDNPNAVNPNTLDASADGATITRRGLPDAALRMLGIADAPTATEIAEKQAAEVLILSNDPVLPVGAAGLAAGGFSDSNMLGELPPARVDMKGVAFNADYCSEAKDPFYSSGPNRGQWKCKRGVPGATYDHWYLNELAAGSATVEPAPATTVDVSQAFATTAPAAAAPVTKPAPRNCGELMVWVSEQQVAGNITPEQVQNAYARHNLTLPDLFPPNAADVVEARIALIYGDLA